MKKEKRELTLKQLERKEKFFAYILPRILIILLFLICAFFAIISAKKRISAEKTISIYTIIALFWVVIVLLSYKVSDKIKKQIMIKEKQVSDKIENKIEKQMKLEVLKQLAKEHEGCIKDFVSLKDKNVITDVLSNNIVRITIDFIQDNNFVTTIQYADDTFRSGIRIPAKEFVSILDENSKKIMLNDSIKNIILGDSVGDIKEIVITGTTYIYKEDISDDELLEMFELKE